MYPSEGITYNLHRTLKGLEADGVISIERSPTEPDTILSVALSDQERESGRENFDFYCFLIWPFIEGSWLAGVAIIGLCPPLSPSQAGEANSEEEVWLPLKDTQEMAQLLGKTLYHQGDLSYFEAVNKQTIANSFQRFEEGGIIIVRKPNSTPSFNGTGKTTPTVAVCKLASAWIPPRDPVTGRIQTIGRLWSFVEMIARSRREGKNRRDGKTVSTRVLRLVEELGGRLFEKSGILLDSRGNDVREAVTGGAGSDVDKRKVRGDGARKRGSRL